MVSLNFAAPEAFFCILAISLVTNRLNAQTCLTLSSAKIKPGNTALLELSLNSLSGARPATVQWKFQSLPKSIINITVDDGPVLASAQKTVICAGDAAAYRCLIVGANRNVIPSGVVARVTAALTPGTGTATILVANPLGAAAGGYPIPVRSESGAITVVNGFPAREPGPPLGHSAGRGACAAQLQEKDR